MTVEQARDALGAAIASYGDIMESKDGNPIDAALSVNVAIEVFEQAVRHDELAKFRAIAERKDEAEGVGHA